MEDWKNKKFLLDCIENPHRKSTEYFHNGTWFVLEESLTELFKKLKNPKIESQKKRKICVSCKEKEFDVLSYEVERWDDCTKYSTRDSILILNSTKFFLNYFELEFPFGLKKEKEILKRIEDNVPTAMKEKAEYYEFQSECVDFLRDLRSKKNIKMNGYFVTCSEHTKDKFLEGILKKFVEGTLKTGPDSLLYPFLGNDALGSPSGLCFFIEDNYKANEIKSKVISKKSLIESLRRKKYLTDLN